ncbi:putative glycosyl transferase [Nostoc sp. NIES-4103]|nr:putative glycosyl transferase [Nostoc sp. NIES-4103]
MKILLTQNLLYFPTLSGGTKANRAIAQGFVNQGHTCRVVVSSTIPIGLGPRTRSEFLRELALRGISFTPAAVEVDVFHLEGVDVHAVADPALLPSYLIDQIREFDPDWVIISEDTGQSLSKAAMQVCPSRVVHLVHSTAELPCGPNALLPSAAGTELFKQTTGIITVSHYLKNYIQQWLGLDATVIPSPVYGSGPFPNFGKFDRGFVTLINPCAVKGISIFLQLAQVFPDVDFAAVLTWGTTPTEVAALKQLPNVQILQPVDDIDEIFAQTGILLVPSLWDEAFGLIVVEAMLRGIPVLASNVGGLPEAKLGVDYLLPVQVFQGYNGIVNNYHQPIIAQQDIEPWRLALTELLSDYGRYEQISEESRKQALKFVSGLGIAPYEDFLTNLAATKLAAVARG